MLGKGSTLLSACVLIGILFVFGCASPRQFAIIPTGRSLEIEESQTFGTCKYEPSSDERTMMDRTGQGSAGAENQLGDQNFSNPLLPAFDIHMKTTLQKSGLFDAYFLDRSGCRLSGLQSRFTFSKSWTHGHWLIYYGSRWRSLGIRFW